MKSFNSIQTNLRYIWPYIWRYRKWSALVILFVLLKELSVLGEPLIYRQVILVFESLFALEITHDLAIQKTIFLIIGFVCLQGLVIVSNGLMLHFTNRLDASAMRDGANDFVGKVLNLSFRFHSERKTGKLAKEFARGVNGIEAFLDAFVFNLIPLLIRLTVIFIVYVVIEWRIALVLLVQAIVFCVFTIIASIKMQHRRDTANSFDDEGSRKAMDALMNAEVVKYFHQEQEEIKSFKKTRQVWKDNKQYEWDGWKWVSSGQILINVSSVVILLMIAIPLLISGDMGLANFVLVISYLGYLVGILWDFQHHVRRLQEALTDLTAFFSYFGKENEISDAASAKTLEVKQGLIRFEQVQFAYQGSSGVFEDLSFTVPAGKSVALVGPSGVGKSTIIKMLYRFYEPTGGYITIDGQNINEVTQQSLRQQLSIVPQETALFNETVAYNIAYGTKAVTREQIETAAREAHADELIANLPQGYDTLVGERGVKLSGGEKQRIAIARAFLRDAPILVLDEATSSLDSASEAEIQLALKGLMNGRTTLIIAHRLSTIMSADLIIVLSDGGIVQQGTHEELLEHGGLYQKLWELQAGGYIE
ncbi:MAG: hypothetical protein COW24_03025 [Candidatus Kerfeldbacteria bacterium CG15_BIG_FIL_POST_REV_8_21_14_020_45_12]|uniref:ABC transporter ATP-binding protein n=1 Tax=Candidatus Kerfeldbacteria bacterium CG15_BIG_FIL_POST_REV_8_21_14_020_45_12 TaxID=2014247 RepID=A0A2M7H3U5_9BACT|nr:MAG: hypothetical protein COW24_03025 [Candidatus Kerfeldbacteria bacterium CG15_BIG_FIL_POST_REV_8_21_14_020_45_12]PJA93009.1 MAG: hypothetical protein CO132_05175 [Candidatus Kerfeldbacteria bacterium CG_4_9_14_3_um_filter_45_8]